jgi:hypothetical protein
MALRLLVIKLQARSEVKEGQEALRKTKQYLPSTYPAAFKNTQYKLRLQGPYENGSVNDYALISLSGQRLIQHNVIMYAHLSVHKLYDTEVTAHNWLYIQIRYITQLPFH